MPRVGVAPPFLVNKMDRENANFARCVSDIQATFGRHCVPFQLPIGDAQGFKGVISAVRPPAEVPPELASELAAARERLVEAAAEADEGLADKYLEGEQLTDDKIVAALRAAVWRGELVPILAGSATQNLGVDEFSDMVRAFLPSPVEGHKPQMADTAPEEESGIEPETGGPLAALVFKTTADPFVGKLSLFRVYRGTFKSNSEVWNSVRGQSERIGQLYLPRGKSQENVPEVAAGDMGAIGKLAVTLTGDTLCLRDQQVTFRPMDLPVGYYSVAVLPATKADLDKMSLSLSRIVEEDPTLRYTRDPDTGEALITGLGDAQIEVAIDRIRRNSAPSCELSCPAWPTGRPSLRSPRQSTGTRSRRADTVSTGMF